MGRHPQLRALETPLTDFSAAGFFGVTLPELLRTHRKSARAVGGRFGFVVGGAEWVVDLDHGRVRGDAAGHVVQDDDDLDAVLRLSEDEFAQTLRGSAPDGARLDERRPGALQALTRFLAEALG